MTPSETAYLVFSPRTGAWAFCRTRAQAFAYVKLWRGAGVVDVGGCWKAFRQHTGGDLNAMFGADEVARMMGVSRSYFNKLVSLGIVPPAVQGGRGRARSFWNYREAFLAALVGLLSRNRFSEKHLVAFAQDVRDGARESRVREAVT